MSHSLFDACWETDPFRINRGFVPTNALLRGKYCHLRWLLANLKKASWFYLMVLFSMAHSNSFHAEAFHEDFASQKISF